MPPSAGARRMPPLDRAQPLPAGLATAPTVKVHLLLVEAPTALAATIALLPVTMPALAETQAPRLGRRFQQCRCQAHWPEPICSKKLWWGGLLQQSCS